MKNLIANNASKGVTTSIALAASILARKYPSGMKVVAGESVVGTSVAGDFVGDFTVVFDVRGASVGLISDGDPDECLRRLGCDMVVCATTAHGEMKYEAAVTTKYGTDVIWAANPIAYDARIAERLNIGYAEFIVKLVEMQVLSMMKM